MKEKIDRTGEIGYNKFGSLMKIIEYQNCNNMIVQFENGYKTQTKYITFQKGEIKNPYDKIVYGVGYLGEGNYKMSKNGKQTKQYDKWHGMLRRCYDIKSSVKSPTYKDCTVCEEWHNFQNFAKWYDENYYEVEYEKMHLDKDILIKGNKIYSPNTCVFVPQNINTLFIKCDASRGYSPIGVSYKKKTNNYKVTVSQGVTNSGKHIGTFINENDAFEAYKKEKEKLIKNIADKYKNKFPQFPQKLYEAMYNYKVEITD